MRRRAFPIVLMSVFLPCGFCNLFLPSAENSPPPSLPQAGTSSTASSSNPNLYGPLVETVDCETLTGYDLDEFFYEDEGEELVFECGTMTAPERHENSDGPTIELAYVRLRSTSPNPQPDPLLIEQGGPGGSSIDIMVIMAVFDGLIDILAERDVVAIDQRGTGYSSPKLTCPEVVEYRINRFSVGAGYSDLARKQGAWQACYDRWAAEGVDLSAYNSLQNTTDRAMGMQALGYPVFNFYGASYGTMVGQHLMRDYPQHLRSVILDAIVPLDTNPFYRVSRSYSAALQRLFEFCAGDTDCNASYPDLETRFLETVTRLNGRPVPRTMNVDGETTILLITGDFMVEYMFGRLQQGLISEVLRIVHEFSEGNFESAESQFFSTEDDISIALAMQASVLCAEEADFPEITVDEFYYPEVVTAVDDLLGYNLPITCAVWPVELLDDSTDDAVISDIPALLLSGEYDPITPSIYAEVLAETLPNSTIVTAPGKSHGIFGVDECVMGIAAQFLQDPTFPLATSCLDDMETNWDGSFDFGDF